MLDLSLLREELARLMHEEKMSFEAALATILQRAYEQGQRDAS